MQMPKIAINLHVQAITKDFLPVSSTYYNEPLLPTFLHFLNKIPDTIFKILLKGKSRVHIRFFLFFQTHGGLLVKNVLKLE